MTPGLVLVDSVAALSCGWFAFIAVRVARSVRAIPRIEDLAPPEPARWPKLSLIVPACNEEASLRQAMTSRLADDYPELEAVIVEDRSTDGTPQIADALAAADPRVRVVHLTELPAGWLGKLNAMQKGADQATGEWLLFSDADIHFEPGTLRKVVAHAEARKLDNVVCIARILPAGAWVDAGIDAMMLAVAIGVDMTAIEDPKSRDAVGSGMFSLVRRDMLAKTPGFAWLKLEVIDDLVLGQMLKDHGARQTVINASSAMWLDWYRDVPEMARQFEKNGFALFGRYRFWLLLTSISLLLAMTWGAYVGLALGEPWLRAVCAVAVVASMASQIAVARFMGRRPWRALLAPIGATILMLIGLRAGFLALARGGVMWRGTRYSLAELRGGQRFRL